MSKLTDRLNLADKALENSKKAEAAAPRPSSNSPTSLAASSKARQRKEREKALIEENQRLQQDLEALTKSQEKLRAQLDDQGIGSQVGVYIEGDEIIGKIDPAIVRHSRFRNRLELAFKDPDFLDLKEDIYRLGRNEHPGKVRRITLDDGKPGFEVIYGHRRLEACKQLGLDFHAIISDLDDAQAIESMIRENDKNLPISCYEEAIRFKSWVTEEHIWPTYTAMAEQLGVSKGFVSQRTTILDLPEVIPQAVGDPRLLSLEVWRKINSAYIESPEEVVKLASEIADGANGFTLVDKAEAMARVERLLSAGKKSTRKPSKPKQEFKTSSGVPLFATKRSQLVVEFDPKIDAETRSEAVKMLEEFLSSRVSTS
ncbi:ParB/RepB/Spo0J family partition protein [Marinobacter sp. P4B1]|uniref:ParB/RepB/Spo0J family partition protein n=1 Tax=Marinobacter sp. P4B1 TaxID=1119533 RepID=UPI00071E056E|nr:ParB/RepB/Spo0J family partition protein [Marinobacter sp. P4B1]KRW83625.1 hypothetical protein AQ621_16385 [Marinobacter sp. P4B1]